MDCNKDKRWPDKTNISCWWCCHKFDNTPCSLPYNYKKDKFYVQAGAGIVADSKPLKEYEETINKAKALINALK